MGARRLEFVIRIDHSNRRLALRSSSCWQYGQFKIPFIRKLSFTQVLNAALRVALREELKEGIKKENRRAGSKTSARCGWSVLFGVRKSIH